MSDRSDAAFHLPFVMAWAFCIIFYFLQYARCSALGAMVPELTTAFELSTLGVSALIGLYYYTDSSFAIVLGACFDRYCAKCVVPAGIVLLAGGSVLFGMGASIAAEAGRLFQGAGSAFAFTGAVYLATRGFPARHLATAISLTQCFGILGGVAAAILALVAFIVTPGGHAVRTAARGSIWSMFTRYNSVFTNPQSYLCGFAAALLFLPTTVGDMIWGVSFLREGGHIDYPEAVIRETGTALGRRPLILAGAVT